MSEVSNVFSVLKQYNGDSWFFLFFLAAAGYLLATGEREERRKILLVAAAAVLLVFNDLSLRIVSKVVGSATYYRFLWMIPIVPLVGYVLVDLFIRRKTAAGKGVVAVMAALMLALGGTSCVNRDTLELPSRVHYVDPEIITMGELIEADKNREFPRVASSVEIALPIRLTNSSLRNVIKRNTYFKNGEITTNTGSNRRQKWAYRLVNGETLKAETIQNLIEKGKIDYFVIATRYQMDELMTEAGCTVLAETGNYTIYRTYLDILE